MNSLGKNYLKCFVIILFLCFNVLIINYVNVSAGTINHNLQVITENGELISQSPIAFGVDVSKYQGHIDWATVKADNKVDFAIIKCGSFNSGIDTEFYNNVNGCVEYDIPFGIYIYSYADCVQDAIDEALYAVNLIKGYPVSYPICYDIEDVMQSNLSSIEKQNLINAFCSTVKSLGYCPLVYSSKHWLEKKIINVEWDVWVAQYNTDCTYNDKFVIWQNSSSAILNGIPKRVDTNYQYHSFESNILKNGLYRFDNYVFCRKDYVLQYGLFIHNGNVYYADDKGRLQSGNININGKTYYFDETTYRMKYDGN